MLAAVATEALGYAASGLVVLALTMRSILRLRIISLCGSVAFLSYGILIESTPIIITNVCIAAINVWFLRKEFLLARGDSHDLGVSSIRPDSPFLLDFIEYHTSDIHQFQPTFSMPLPTSDGTDRSDVAALLLTREGLPAGLVVGRHRDGRMTIDLDYVLREHRDSRLGAWLYGPGLDVFRGLGLHHLESDGITDTHRRYLRRVGFEPSTDSTDPDRFVLAL